MSAVVLNQRYRLLDKVGEGGMAQVYRAEDLRLDRVVAVKILRDQYATDPEFLARFRHEAHAAAGLAHPNIVHVYDVGAEGDTNYIVMEYVDGPSLKAVIAREGPLGVARSVELAGQILSALHHAHQKGIVHRDVKPQNILMGTDGQAKVADFGIALAASSPQLTETGVVLATAQYCSPEQALGRGATAASDIYSAGVVLYEMLTGRLPFDGEGPLAIALKHVQERPAPPTRLNPRIPRRLEAIVLQAMAKEPERRFQTAADMRQALRTYQQFGEEMTATFRAVRGQTPTASEKPAGRIDWLAVVLGVIVMLAMIGVVPLGLRVYDIYFRQPVAVVVPTPTVAAFPTPAPLATVVPTRVPSATAVPAVLPSPTAVSNIQVPNLIGVPFDQAQLALDKLGLRIKMVDEVFDERYPEKAVTAQSYSPGTLLKAGDTVEVVVGKGAEKVLVPALLGVPLADALATLDIAGLKSTVLDEWNDQVVAGQVSAQQPGPGESVNRGATISVVVSKGPQPTPPPPPSPTPPLGVRPPEGDWAWVPNLVGLPEAEAQQRIGQAGLSTTYVNYQEEKDVADKTFFNSIQPGHVLSSNPLAGTKVPRGTKVALAVRKPVP